MNKTIEIKGAEEESRVRELEAEIVDDQIERNLGQLRDIEDQVKMVGSKLE